jgi:Tol biopolymer transport system component
VVGVSREGKTREPSVTLKVPGNRAPCPKWSSDGSRLAYLDDRGTVVVRGLDGSTQHWAAGDPTRHDLALDPRAVPSPTGKLVARLSHYRIVVSRPDGSHTRVVKAWATPYAIAGWSPDGRQLLIMTDGPYMMRAVSINAPFTLTRIVDYIPINNDRSWPGYGDVSWQPSPRP